jgi:hypothetical protein
MTDVERTDIESYLNNISNLIALQTALDKSLTHTRSQLPPELRESNPLGIWRLVDGKWQK